MTTQEPRSTEEPGIESGEASTDTARRAFLAKCGKLAVITPPAVTLMLSAASRNYAVAGSGFGDPGRPRHSGKDHDGPRRHRDGHKKHAHFKHKNKHRDRD